MQTRDNRFDQLICHKVNACCYKKIPQHMKESFGKLHELFEIVCMRDDWESPDCESARTVILKAANAHVWAGVADNEKVKLVRAMAVEAKPILDNLGLEWIINY